VINEILPMTGLEPGETHHAEHQPEENNDQVHCSGHISPHSTGNALLDCFNTHYLDELRVFSRKRGELLLTRVQGKYFGGLFSTKIHNLEDY
jgi:hypothetical protein